MKTSCLSAEQAAKSGRSIWFSFGLQPCVYQYYYYSMGKQDQSIEALMAQSLMIGGLVQPPLAVVVTEYAFQKLTAGATNLDISEQDELFPYRITLLCECGAIVPESEAAKKKEILPIDDISQFKIDEALKNALIKEGTNGTMQLEAGYKAARIEMGLKGNCILHKELNSKVRLNDLFSCEDFFETDEYREFLESEKVQVENNLKVQT